MRTCRDRRFRKNQPVTRKLGVRSHCQSTAPNQMLRSLLSGWGFSVWQVRFQGTPFVHPGTFRLKRDVIERSPAESVLGADPWESGKPHVPLNPSPRGPQAAG
jgi:hypothetical protein